VEGVKHFSPESYVRLKIDAEEYSLLCDRINGISIVWDPQLRRDIQAIENV